MLRQPPTAVPTDCRNNLETISGNITQVTKFGAEVIENYHCDTDEENPNCRKRLSIDSEQGITAVDENEGSVNTFEGASEIAIKESNSQSTRLNVQVKHGLFFTYSNICALSMVGCAIRIGLDLAMGSNGLNIENSDNVIFVSFVSNMMGSFFLGLLVGSNLKEMAGMLPIAVGISTGLCGSITTFSKFMQQVSLMLVGETEPDGNRFFTAFISILLGLSAPLASYIFGRDIFTLFGHNNYKASSQQSNRTSSKSFKIGIIMNYSLTILFIPSLIALITVSIIYQSHYNVMSNCVSVVFAPVGALTRFNLAKLNVRHFKSHFMNVTPVGTLLANLIGSVFLSTLHVILTWVQISCAWTAVLFALGTGLCACLTTVSTLVSEIYILRDKGEIGYSHIYPLCTIVICLSLSTIINGVSFAVHNDSQVYHENNTCS